MARIYASIQISARVEAVFDYATTPANAPKWHPTSLGVSGEIDHSVEKGERFTEELRVFAGAAGARELDLCGALVSAQVGD